MVLGTIKASGLTLDEAEAQTEERLRILRSCKAAVASVAGPKPRTETPTRKKATGGQPATTVHTSKVGAAPEKEGA